MATYPTNPASTFLQATDLAVFASNQLYDFVNGDITVSIETEEGGDIPSVAKALHEAAAYREPIAWSNGAVQTDLVQPRDFNNTIYVPRLVPVTLGASPTTGPSGEWRILFRGAPATVTDTTTNNHTATTHTHELDLSAVTSAAAIGYDNTTSGLTASELQGAVDEVKGLATQPATESQTGVVELATDAEAQAFTVNKFLDGAKLASALQGANQDLSTSGYQKLPGGLIIQWGEVLSHTSGTSISFPITFPNQCFSVFCQDHAISVGSTVATGVNSSPTTSSFIAYHDNPDGPNFWFFAVGF